MINYVIGDNVFELNVNDIVYVKAVVNGYFGVVKKIEEDICRDSDEPYAIRKIVIHRPHHYDDKTFIVNSEYTMDRYAGITKIPKDLFGSMVLYKEKLYKVLFFDISKTFPLRIENAKTKYNEWIGANDFIYVNWRKDDVENVNAENYHKCVWNNADNKLKEAEKTEKAFEGVEFNMDTRTLVDILRQERDIFKTAVNEKCCSLYRPENQITINSDGVKVTYARCGDLVASSRCHDDDKFDMWTGAKIALERLEKKFIEKAEREKKEKLLNNWYDSLTEEMKEFVKKKLQEEK